MGNLRRIRLLGLGLLGLVFLFIVISAAQAAAPVDVMDGVFSARSDMNVRAAPSTAAQRVAGITAGSMVVVNGRTRAGDWYRIDLGSGRNGYVFGELLEAIVIRQAPPPAEPVPAQPEPAATRSVAAPEPPAPEPTQPAPAVATTTSTSNNAGQTAALPVGAGAPTGPAYSDCAGCPEMVPLSAGSFVMGINGDDPTNGPAHKVALARGFALGRFEVTVGQWRLCVAAAACGAVARLSDAADDEPVRYLTHDDALSYVAWLAQKTGKAYRLPSEAEWEFAARAGTTSTYWWGDAVGQGRANCKDCGGDYDRKRPSAVGRLGANPFGFHDMNGGVAEWVADCWFPSHGGAPGDGRTRVKDDCRQRVLRGGAWRNDSSYLRSGARFYYDAAVPYSTNGLRVAVTLP